MSSNSQLAEVNSNAENFEVSIRVSNLSKNYQLYARPEDRLKQSILPRVRRLLGLQPKKYFNEFWALRNVSFEARRGETIGIIGRNGAGKSTILQIICGTLTPSSGSVETFGRVAALLELGSGFNPEFTGRENVYLNASILGLTKEEIDSRFDQIVKFADIGEFLDQPVKLYSSGMYVRLAFAIIAHVDADILVVDEALAVGDAVFTQKCMRFIRNFQKNGTLIFVSHDTSTVQSLCERAIWLANGMVRGIGLSKSIAEDYLHYTLQETYGDEVQLNEVGTKKDNEDGEIQQDVLAVEYETELLVKNNLEDASGWNTGDAEILSVCLENINTTSEHEQVFEGGEHVRLSVKTLAHKPILKPIVGFIWRDRLGQALFGENTVPVSTITPCSIPAGEQFTAKFEFQLPMLPNGEYSVTAAISDGTLHDHVQHHWLNDALIVSVSSSKVRWGLIGIKFNGISLEVENASPN